MHSVPRRIASLTVGVWVTLLPALLWAHPGHGATDPQTAAHYASEPVHVAPLVIVALCAISALMAFVRVRSARLAKQPLPVRKQ